MSHNFETGVFYGQPAWHGLGTTLEASDPRRHSVEDTLVAANMDWTVRKYPIQLASSPDVPADLRGGGILGSWAVVRDNGSVLGIVGDRYEELQNRQIFQWFQPFLDTGECSFETAGSLSDGRIVWVLARLEAGDLDVGGGDMVRRYLLLSSSHDGSMSTRVGFCPTRVVCWNTLSMAIRHKASRLLRVKHTVGQSDSLVAVRDAICLANESFEATAEQYRKLAACGINRSDLRRYVKLVLELPEDDSAISTRSQNNVDRIVQLAIGGRGQDGSLTAWAAYQGVTEWLTHERQKDQQKRVESLWFGDSSKLNLRAFELALQLSA